MLERKISTERTTYSTTSWYVVKGELGAVHYMFMRLTAHGMDKTYPLDIGVHSPRPLYEEQGHLDNCDVLGGKCYYSGSMKLATDLYNRFRVCQDTERLWQDLENYYGRALAL